MITTTNKPLPDIIWLKDRYPEIAARHREDGTDFEPSAAHMAAAAFSDAEQYAMQEYSSVTAADQKLELRATKPIASVPDTTYSPFARPEPDEAFRAEQRARAERAAAEVSGENSAEPENLQETCFTYSGASGERILFPKNTDGSFSYSEAWKNAGDNDTAGDSGSDAADTGDLTEELTIQPPDKVLWRCNAMLLAAVGFFFNIAFICLYVRGTIFADGTETEYGKALGRCLAALCGAGAVTFAVMMLTKKVSYSLLLPIAAVAVAFSVLSLAGRVNRQARKAEESAPNEPFYYYGDGDMRYRWDDYYYENPTYDYYDEYGVYHTVTTVNPAYENTDWDAEPYSKDRYIRAIIYAAAAGTMLGFFVIYLIRRKLLWLILCGLCGVASGVTGWKLYEEAFPAFLWNRFAVWNLLWFSVIAVLFVYACPRLQKPKENVLKTAK
ncbi:MAG: hypothetical protein J5845_07835 [Lachnospiraceae bacterium]|nr:hypothetical protein [Lachnospiraceae bacterium]